MADRRQPHIPHKRAPTKTRRVCFESQCGQNTCMFCSQSALECETFLESYRVKNISLKRRFRS